MNHHFFETKIEFLKGVGPKKASVLNKEAGIFTYGDLLQYFPFRHEDRSQFHKVRDINEQMPYIQLKGTFKSLQTYGDGHKKRLVGQFHDDSGSIEVVWFKGIKWISQKIAVGIPYTIFGKPNVYGSKINLSHPEVEEINPNASNQNSPALSPVYNTTERMKNAFLDSKAIGKLTEALLSIMDGSVEENLPEGLLQHFNLIERSVALKNMHHPSSINWLNAAKSRLKFEELFFIQLQILKLKLFKSTNYKGQSLPETHMLNDFYKNHLPFELTGAQKRVIREAYEDMKSNKQMNRLIQGDVGSGKTMVAFICMLIAASNKSQSCLMAPTEILAGQHYEGLKEFSKKLGLNIALLTGSTRKKERDQIHTALESGTLNILIGTHALLEDKVKFQNLGLAVIDEQHRFGVAQRAKLWSKNKDFYPHMLVMTATPIPRTLAMTMYGDLDVSIIDELPAGRKPILTQHMHDKHRLKINSFIKSEIKKGRQIYIVYPLIEENEKLGLKDLMDGYESASRAFPEHHLSIVHGKMKPDAKEFEMQRFLKGETQIMVATTVIEVGVNVPNASVMVIENSERFGLAQLHQLRGRVGRGAEQSYCILVSKEKLSKEGKIRMETMVRTNNGFEIADTDLKLRGPGDLSGTQQSGIMDLLVADIVEDSDILKAARKSAQHILTKDPELSSPQNSPIKKHIDRKTNNSVNWSRIS
ncbi:ATP-dependent DNA helicase RecG [Aureibacter tunicatorum]|uniref:ATP-dependent DNA helicase RecG n=1 Tax=Aureibacter tunicatorum TaxID=866807 RepID=A0AAE3XHW4_9BACT|nr:ATP-dependent DNA helicase RecG [Aureibacter tunicatorum]MDR6237107.1 ATP-dependent DNA helicase RecG [Aureibacter tunicatorum]BDD06099.1 ATP-dependent DNA helicase RecG [Aureibacter tunicatorum]